MNKVLRNSKPSRFLLFLVALPTMGLVMSCSQSDGISLPPKGNLPVSWYQLPQNGSSSPGLTPSSPDEEPSRAMEDSVRAQFRAHTGALEKLSQSGSPLQPNPAIYGKDYVPWHLDGMIANFAITVNGVFGALLGGGVANVKATWQQPAKQQAQAHHATQARHIKVNSLLTSKQLIQQLEPAIRSAVATHSVQNEAALRRNLNIEAERFLTLAKVLNALPARRSWHVDSFQQQLTFGIQGQVTPAIGAGGTVNLYWDWQKSSDISSTGGIRETELFRNVEVFAQSMSKLIPEALIDSKELTQSGFVLDQFQVGVGIMAGGQFGIVEALGMAQGKIVFKNAPDNSALPKKTELALSSVRSPTIFVIAADTSEKRLFADQIGARSGATMDGLRGYEVPVDRFRNGIKHALHMAGFFLKNAVAADTSHWKLTQIETEFDANIGGQISLATVVAQGQLVLDFDRVTGK